MVKIRLAVEKDLQAISEMYVTNWKHTYVGLVNQEYLDNLNVPGIIEKWSKYIKTPKQGIFVGEKDGEILGFGAFRPDSNIEDCLYLDSLHVSEKSRDLGLGSMLIKRIGKKAIEEGCKKMSISIIAGNEHARRLYVNRGVSHYEFEKIDFAGKPSNVEWFIWETLDAFKDNSVG